MAHNWSWFDDFTKEERAMIQERRVKEGMNAKELLARFGHPSTWKYEVEQLTLFGGNSGRED